MAKKGSGKSGSAKKAVKKPARKAARPKKTRAKKTTARKTRAKKAPAKKTPAKKYPAAKKKPAKKSGKKGGAGRKRRSASAKVYRAAIPLTDAEGKLIGIKTSEGEFTLQELIDGGDMIGFKVTDTAGVLSFFRNQADGVDSGTCTK